MNIILTESQIKKIIKGLHSEWKEIDGKLIRVYDFPTYDDTISFVNKVAEISIEQNHHPEMVVGFDTVKVIMYDHEEGGISDKCHKFTNAVDNMVDKEESLDERSRSFAFTRKKRLFPKSAMMSNPDRFKEYDKEIKGINEEVESDQMSSDDQCIKPEIDKLNSIFLGLGKLYGGEYEDQEIIDQTSDPKQKQLLSQILSRLKNMNINQLRDELEKVMTLKNLKEQNTPYMEQTIEIGGVQVPKIAVHGVLGLIVISILSTLLKMIPQNQSRGGSRLASRAQGCQGAGARARLVRRRRRRETWKSFLRNLGIG